MTRGQFEATVFFLGIVLLALAIHSCANADDSFDAAVKWANNSQAAHGKKVACRLTIIERLEDKGFCGDVPKDCYDPKTGRGAKCDKHGECTIKNSDGQTRKIKCEAMSDDKCETEARAICDVLVEMPDPPTICQECFNAKVDK